MGNSKLHDNILATLAYFDVFDYPLTSLEVARYLIGPKVSLAEILNGLDQLVTAHKIGTKDGYYFLSAHDSILPTRTDHYFSSQKKWRRVARAVRILRRIPFIEAVFVCNRLAYNNAADTSDLDLCIVSSPGRIFTVRFLATIVFSLLRLRRHGRRIKNRFCLSFYISSAHLNLKDLLLDPEDWHFIIWLYQFVPVYDRSGVYEKFIRANSWLKDYLGHYEDALPASKVLNWAKSPAPLAKFLEKILAGRFGNITEWVLGVIQRAKIKKSSCQLSPEASVIVSDEILKFHPKDKRRLYNSLFAEKLVRLGLDPVVDI